MNIFYGIEKKAKIAKQEEKNGVIIKKQRGAPRKPHMVEKKIKVDKILYQQVRDHCNRKGITISSFLALVLRKELEKNI